MVGVQRCVREHMASGQVVLVGMADQHSVDSFRRNPASLGHGQRRINQEGLVGSRHEQRRAVGIPSGVGADEGDDVVTTMAEPEISVEERGHACEFGR